MTTAQLRNAAQEAERSLLWASAGNLWRMAIAAYPIRAKGLAERDIARMTERAEACDRMAKQEEMA